MAGAGRRGCAARVDRQFLSPPEEPGRGLPGRGCPADVPGPDFERGRTSFRNYLPLRTQPAGRLYQTLWEKARGDKIEGINLADSKAIKQAVSIPVICTGGFQTASVIRAGDLGGACDAVSIARPLVANNDLVKIFERGSTGRPKPCTYCNKCLVNVLQNPLGCYEESRFESREQMIDEIMSVFDPPPFH